MPAWLYSFLEAHWSEVLFGLVGVAVLSWLRSAYVLAIKSARRYY